VKITVERRDEFFVAVSQIFDRVKSVALWSAKKKRTIKGYGRVTQQYYLLLCVGCGTTTRAVMVVLNLSHMSSTFKVFWLSMVYF
jgi:hypothetical protein